jgi:hypothetical protein
MTKQTNGTADWEEIVVGKVNGMDIEPEDRDVGIFGATYTIVLKEENGGQVQLILGEDQMDELARAIKPYTDDIQAQQEMDKMIKDDERRLKNDRNK